MASLPGPVADYLSRLSIAARRPAYLRVGTDGRIHEAGGALPGYGLTLATGECLPAPWQFLSDYLDLEEDSLDIPCIQIDSQVLVDIHLARDHQGVWIIVLDATADEQRQRVVQQKSNELSLLQKQQLLLLGQYVGTGIAETLLGQSWNPSSEGERRVLTVLADLCGFTPYCETRAPGLVFRTLNDYLRAMIEPITAHQGFVDKLIGDEVMSLFGLLPTAGPQSGAAIQALRAARAIVASVRSQHTQAEFKVALEVSIGIATGPVAIGILGTKDRRSFTAIGHHVNLAARLVSQAAPGEILIDEATYAKLGEEAGQLKPRALMLKGLATPMTAYSVTV